MKLPDYQQYYLYEHRDPNTGELLYVGKGASYRAWTYSSTTRSSAHLAHLQRLEREGRAPDEWTNILHRNLSEVDAIRMEEHLINKDAPKYNKAKNKEFWKETKRNKDGEVGEFASMLHKMGIGYRNIAFLLGADVPKNRVMSIKRMVVAHAN